MPHLVFEYAAPLASKIDLFELLKKTHQALCVAPTVDGAAVKSRLFSCDMFQVGLGESELFLHGELRLLVGRPLEVRMEIRDAIVKVLKAVIPAGIAFSFEVREMIPETYYK